VSGVASRGTEFPDATLRDRGRVVSGAAKAAETFVAGVRLALDTRAVDPTDPLACVDLLKALDREIERDPVAGETTGIDISAIARKGSLDSADALARLPLTRSRTFPDDVAVVVGWLDEPSPRS